MMLFFADPGDPDVDPAALLFSSAQSGSISGMEKALKKDPELIYASEVFDSMSVLHLAAACPKAGGVDAVRWLLEKGIPWSAKDAKDRIPEDLARMMGNEESCKVLREWAVQKEYELYYKTTRLEDHPDHNKPFTTLRLDELLENDIWCKSQISFVNPHGAPEDEVAMICKPNGTGIMMEWERPIMRETARLLLDGMPTTGLRVLNIGFGLGMIDTYFQEAHPAEDVIIEGHPMCLRWMWHKGWYDRPGVRVLEGRWQDFFLPPGESPPSDADQCLSPNQISGSQALLPPLGSKEFPDSARLAVDIGKFDIVYFDTFMEGYRGHFAFIKHVPRLLRGPGSRFSYFNGHAALSNLEYKIYAEVQRLHHNDLGMNTQWFEVYTEQKDMWYNISERGKGRLEEHPQLIPICALAPTVPQSVVCGVGWNGYSDPAHCAESVDVDSVARGLESCSVGD